MPRNAGRERKERIRVWFHWIRMHSPQILRTFLLLSVIFRPFLFKSSDTPFPGQRSHIHSLTSGFCLRGKSYNQHPPPYLPLLFTNSHIHTNCGGKGLWVRVSIQSLKTTAPGPTFTGDPRFIWAGRGQVPIVFNSPSKFLEAMKDMIDRICHYLPRCVRACCCILWLCSLDQIQNMTSVLFTLGLSLCSAD